MKNNLKKTLLLCLSFVLVAALAIGGTIAYLTDTDRKTNVMTVGNIDIEQIEQERDDNGKLVDFTQAKKLLPAVYVGDAPNASIPWDSAENWAVANNEAWKTVDKTSTNVIDKFVTVKNTGSEEAYVRTIIAYEGDVISGTDIHVVHNSVTSSNADVSGEFAATDYIENVIIDDVRYDIIVYTYKNPLEAHTTTIPSLKQVYMDKGCDNDDVKKYGDTYDILVFSQAVQAAGFPDAVTALNDAFGEIAATNHPWMDGADIPAVVNNAEDMVAALESGKGVVLTESVKINPAQLSNAYGTTGINVKNGQTIDGNGNTIDIKGAGGTWDSGINTTGGTIKNITVTGSFRGIFINHNSNYSAPVVLDNVTIKGTTYTISCDQGMNQGLIATNSKFYGWTSYAATLGTATFENCSFGEGNGYAYCRPYAPTTFVNCEFEAGFEMDTRAAVTFENCTIGGVPLTADNLATLVTSNIANATVK